MASETAVVFAELLEELGVLHRRLVEQLSGPGDEQSLLEAHKWVLTILQVATDTQVWADPARTYRVRVTPGDAVYLSLTVYGGPRDGHYSDRIVGSINSQQAPPGPDGTIEMVLSPVDPGPGVPWIRLEPDAVAIVTRDYLDDWVDDARAVWSIA